MSRSTRLIYRNQQGRLRKNLNWDAITKRSAVIMRQPHPTVGSFA
jgi:hypothetical protein